MDFKIESRTGAYLFMAIGVTFVFACIYLSVREGSIAAVNGLLAIAGGLCIGKGLTIFRHLSDKEKSGKDARGGAGTKQNNPAGLNRAQRRRNKNNK